jgi:hypothetical protein
MNSDFMMRLVVHISTSGSPLQALRIRVESFIFGKQQGFACEFQKFLFSVGASGIEDGGDFPAWSGVASGYAGTSSGARGDEISIHGPVGVLAEGEAFGGVVVGGLRKRDEVRGIVEGDIVAGGEADAEAASGALVIVDFHDLAAEGGTAAVFEGLLGDEGDGLMIVDW